MAAGDPGSPARYYSSIAVETALGSSIPAQSQGQANTSFIVGSISGFPTDYPYTLIVDPDTSKEEVVTVYGGSGTTLSVYRGADNTQAVAHSAGAVVRHGVSGRDFRESENHIAARGYDIDQTILNAANQTHVHGVATGDGVIVGTLKEQTLTRKTLTTPTINGATISGAVTSTATVTGGTFTSVTVTSSTISTSTFTGSFTASAATFVSPTISGSPVITGLSSAGMVDTSATPKNYVDSILGSATAAATSAASAAASAAAAATSATSASASASAAASSASASATSASAAATSATSAAASATAAATSATSAAASALASATSATASASSASAAATSATNAAASASAASTSATSAAASATAAATSATSAAASATAAATSAASALASATAAATSATSAANSATAAAASVATIASYASAAATSATSAATSATSADASATAAATSAASASTSASSALTSANSAAASYDSFDDRYLGSKSTPPTLDNDGNALITGALYWNSVDNTMYVWSGTAWGSISSTAEIYRYRYVATAGQTTFSGSDANGATLSYLVGKEQVYLNGVLQVRSTDYTATDGSSIVLASGAAVSDVLEIITFTAFSVIMSAMTDVQNTFVTDQIINGVTVGEGASSITTNVALGQSALAVNTTGGSNVAVGSYVLDANTTGGRNTALGYRALTSHTSGDGNTALGADALYANTTGINNVAVGNNALASNTTGSYNIGIGANALASSNSGNNVGIGRSALEATTGGENNVAVGALALDSNTNGSFNTAVGYGAGDTITTGNYNTSIGYNAEPTSATVSGEFTLGDANVTNLRCNDTSISSLSDGRDKTDVVDNPYGLEFLKTIKSRKFTWDTREGNIKDGQTRLGFIAQELLEATDGENDIIDLVYESNPDRLEAKYGNLIPILVKAIQELAAEVELLKGAK
jgi:hypothetical protein